MAYGLQSTPRVHEGATPFLARQRSTAAARPWRSLDADHRLALIEQSLDRRGIRDGYPLAL